LSELWDKISEDFLAREEKLKERNGINYELDASTYLQLVYDAFVEDLDKKILGK
jgi:hypothetical protein